MKRLTLNKGAAVAQVLVSGALAALAANIDLVPAKYQIVAVVAAGALQAVMPSPVKAPQTPAE